MHTKPQIALVTHNILEESIVIQNNKLECSCKTLWLSQWLRKNSHLAHDTKCYTYDKYKEYDLSKLKEEEFDCQDHFEAECETEPLCPYPCSCENGIVDCKEKSLNQIPNMISDTSVELYVIYIYNKKFIH